MIIPPLALVIPTFATAMLDSFRNEPPIMTSEYSLTDVLERVATHTEMRDER